MIGLGLLSTARINREIVAAARLSDRARVVAVASRDRARAEAHADELGIERAHGDYERLLGDEAVEAVYVSLPNSLHHEWTLRALDAGKHVLCEKPFSPRPAEVEEAYDAAERRGLVLMEAFMYRHHPQTHIVRETVERGRLGRLRSIRAAFTFPLANEQDVRMRPELDGGALLDVGCYCVSGARLVAGEPLRVHGEAVRAATGVDAAFHGMLRCPNDVVAYFEASFLVPRRQELVLVGDEATLVVGSPWRVDWPGAVELVGGGGAERIAVPQANAYVEQLENFARAVAGREQPLLGRADALAQARTLEALRASAAEGRAIEL